MRGSRRMDVLIAIEARGAGRDALNNPTKQFSETFRTRAREFPAPGTEKYAAAATVAALPTIFEVRDEARTRAITQAMRIRKLSNGVVYGIKGMDQQGRGGVIRLTAVADV